MAVWTIVTLTGTLSITEASGRSYSQVNSASIVELLGGSEVWATILADNAQFVFRVADTYTINGASYVPANAAALFAKMRDEVFIEPKDFNAFAATITAMGGISILAESLGIPFRLTANTVALADGSARYEALEVKRAGLSTGIIYNIATQGSGNTYDGFNGFALWTIAGGILTKVAETANDGTIWNQALGTYITPWTSQYLLNAEQPYWAAALYNSSVQGVAPGLRGYNQTAATGGNLFYGGIKLSGAVTGQAALPATQALSSLIVGSSSIWFGLY